MGRGIQIFNENGELVVDMNTRISKILGTVTVGEKDGSLTDKRLLDGKMWSQIESVTPKIGKEFFSFGGLKITASGSKLSWEHIKSNSSFVFSYGIY